MAMRTTDFLNVMADVMATDPSTVTETATFDDMGGMDSITRLSMISSLESHFGNAAIFDELKTIADMPTLLTALRARGFVQS